MSEHNPPKSRPRRRPGAKSSNPLGDYEVGYSRPPVATRFAPGQSGNSKGRPRGARNLKDVFDRELDRKITVTERGRERQITKREVIGRQTVDRALKGDDKAIRIIKEYDGSRAMLQGGAGSASAGPVTIDKTDRDILSAFAALIRSGADIHGSTEAPLEHTTHDAQCDVEGD